MEKIPAWMEKYSDSIRITPEKPKVKKGAKSGYHCRRAKVIHWDESDSLDVLLLPEADSSKATTKRILKVDHGSVSRSTLGRYTLRICFDKCEMQAMKRIAPQLLKVMFNAIEDPLPRGRET